MFIDKIKGGFAVLILAFTFNGVFGQENILNQRVELAPGSYTLEQILKQLEKQSDINFSYSDDLVPLDKKVVITRKARTLRSTLQTILKNTQVEYVVRGNLIILKRAKKKPDPIRYTISGTITDLFSGESMIGATVYFPDLKAGVTSNAYGFYSMTVPPGQYELAYSYIGYKSQSFQVGLSSNLKKDLELVLDTAQLETVVIIPQVERNKNITSMVMSAHKMDIKTFGELPYLYGEVDVVRGIKFLPGVSTVGEGAAGFNVRGGSIDQNLILLDEARYIIQPTISG